MRLVIALGGNAILQRNQPLEENLQRENIKQVCQLIAKVAKQHEVLITHGNGPQIGLLALQNDAYKKVGPYSFDVLGAETEGMIGYWLTQELTNRLYDKIAIALLTRTEVDAHDQAFINPTKFVGPAYDQTQAKSLAADKGWVFKEDGDGFRRVVPSPWPKAIVEQSAINYLLQNKELVLICAGGGGIPVVQRNGGVWQGVEAVVDKDLASCVLAKEIKADGLIMLTDVSAVETHFKQVDSRKIKQASPDKLGQYQFAEGSMEPKVKAACDFAKYSGFAAIGCLTDLEKIVSKAAGTHIVASSDEIDFYA